MKENELLRVVTDLKTLQDTVDNNLNLAISDEIPHEAFTNPQLEKSDSGKGRVWVMMLYPDNEYHAKILETVYTDFVAIGAMHDQDVDRNGRKIKDHVHIVLYFTSPVYKSHITQKYNFYPEIDRWVHKRSEVKRHVRYLLHKDTPSKYQYPESYLEGNVERFAKYFDADGYECSQVVSIINLIERVEFDNLGDLVKCLCENNLYATYRRSAYTFNLIYSERKSKLIEERSKARL